MATEKRLNTRILLRYDEYTNWYNNNPKLLKGEVAIATIPENHTDPSTGAVTQIPAVVMKVGTGAETGSNYRDLPFVSAKAADVLAACKSEAALKTFVNNVIADAGIASSDAMDALAGRVTTVEGDITTLKGDKNTAGSVAKAIEDAITALDLANTYEAKGEASKVQSALDAYKTENNTAVSDLSTDLSTLDSYCRSNLETKLDAADKLSQAKAYADGKDTAIAAAKKAGYDAQADVNTLQFEVDTALGNDKGKTVREIASEEAAKKDEAIAAAKKAGDDAQADVDTLEGNVGSVDGLSTTNKTVVGAINEVLAAVGTGGTAAVVTVEKSTDGLTYTIKQGNVSVGTIDIPKDMVVTAGEVVTNPEGQAEGTYIKLTLANVTDPLYINVGTLVDIYKAKANATQVQVAIDSATREISATIVAGSVGTTELADGAVVTDKIADANVTKAKLSTAVQTSLGLADSAVQEADITDLRSASHTHTFEDADVADAISKKHNHTFVESELNKIADGDVAKWNAAEQNAKNYADSLGVNYDEKGSAGSAELNAKAYADKLASNYATAAQGAKADTAIQTISTPTTTDSEGNTIPNGLKATKAGADVAISIDDSITWIFDCGNATV